MLHLQTTKHLDLLPRLIYLNRIVILDKEIKSHKTLKNYFDQIINLLTAFGNDDAITN